MNNIDVIDAVYGLCDQLSSLQKPTPRSESHASDALQKELAILSSENSSLKENIAALSAREAPSMSSEDDNMICLKEENLRLMKELKSVYRQRDLLRTELRSARSQPQLSSFPTEVGTSGKLPTIQEQPSRDSPAHVPALLNKENSPNKLGPLSQTPNSPNLPRSTPKRELPREIAESAKGFDEAKDDAEEGCAQS